MLQKAVLILFPISITVWIVSLVIHVLSAFGVDILTQIPQLMFLPIVAFFILLSSIFYLRYVNTGAKDKLTWLFNPVPTLFICLAVAGLPYFLGNFFTAAYLPGQPAISEYDGYILKTKRANKIISKEEYHFYQAMTLRILSGAGLAMSGIASFIFYPRKGGEFKSI